MALQFLTGQFVAGQFQNSGSALRQLIIHEDYLTEIFPGIALQDAMNFGIALGAGINNIHLVRSILRVADLHCQDFPPHHQINRGIIPPIGPIPGQSSLFYPVGNHRGAQCGTMRATVMHNGREELILCLQEADVVDANGTTWVCHPYGAGAANDSQPYTHRLVCAGCKHDRRTDFRRQRANWFGVCQACRIWVVDNIPARTSRCTWLPGEGTMDMPFLANNHQSGTFWRASQCVEHDENHWDHVIRPAANAETDQRLRGHRGRRKKRGHGWTRPKKGQGRRPLTPWRKRQAVKRPPPLGQANAHATNIPKCFCGEPFLLMAAHARGNGVATDQVRN